MIRVADLNRQAALCRETARLMSVQEHREELIRIAEECEKLAREQGGAVLRPPSPADGPPVERGSPTSA